MRNKLELAAVGDDHRLCGLAALAAHGLDGLHDLHALGHGAENHVLAIEPVGLHGAEEELRAVGLDSRKRVYYVMEGNRGESEAQAAGVAAH